MLTTAATFAILTLASSLILAVFGESSQAARQHRVDHTVNTMLGGIPQHDSTLGKPTAPYTLQVFADLECHDSRNWFTKYMPAIIQQLVRPGILKIQYRSLKTDTIWPTIFVNQQTAALAAGAQDKMWNYIETFYHEQGTEYTKYATESYLNDLARQVPGLNLEQWHADRQDGRRSEQVTADDQTARELGFHDTPSFRIGPSGGKLQNLTGPSSILYVGQKHPVSLVYAEDIKVAISTLATSKHSSHG